MKQVDIAKKYNVSSMAVSRALAKVSALVTIPNKREMREEITRELADMHLGKILHEVETNYDNAKAAGNQQLAGSWLIQYQAVVDKLLKVTGRYNAPLEAPKTININFRKLP